MKSRDFPVGNDLRTQNFSLTLWPIRVVCYQHIQFDPTSRKIMKTLVAGVVLSVLSCTQSTRVVEKDRSNCIPESAVADKLGAGYVVEYSGDRAFALAVVRSKSTALHPETSIHYAVLATSTCEIVHEDQIANGSVAWVSASEIEVRIMPGIVPKDEPKKPLGYRFHVINKMKKELSQSYLKEE